ncbi:hypothetical protein A9Q84_15960 [Halobacteriovorax marinus]|uniref:Response regulatory domain-containing protein n=1 Tax=Halobacteriovorax marinus TaxID=97084 RepID=A0A1Y5F809_9BACT|nr:hypothetical protein A9Q84_15960 [Halobacteriovorax marinus]
MNKYSFILQVGSSELSTYMNQLLKDENDYKSVTANSYNGATRKLENQTFSTAILEHKVKSLDAMQMYNYIREKLPIIPICIIVSNDKIELFNSLKNLDCNLEIISKPLKDDDSKHFSECLIKFVHSVRSRDVELSNLLKFSRFLVVDDAKINRVYLKDFIQTYFTSDKVKIDEAEDGIQAIKKIKENTYDIVLLDFTMPKIEGDDILRIIRKKYSKTELPVIVISAQDNLEKVKELITAGVNDYVPRPIDHDILLSKISRTLKRCA